MRRLLALSLLLTLVQSAHAQQGADVLATWQRAWDRAVEGVETITVTESSEQQMRGPRGTHRTSTEARVRYPASGRPSRTVLRATAGGETLSQEQRDRLAARQHRALGRRAASALRPPSLPGSLLRGATVEEATSMEHGGRSVWRLRLRLARDEARTTAYFSMSNGSPQLTLLEMDKQLQPESRMRSRVTFTRQDGLDLPLSSTTEIQTRQQRRLRSYAVGVVLESTFAEHSVSRN